MDIFVTVKAAVTVSQAAEHYGLQVNRNDMTCCPFHDDRHPSMKLNERYFYCFGCGATGDVIDLVAKLFDLSSYEAAKKLAHDFGIGPDKPPSAVALPKPERPLKSISAGGSALLTGAVRLSASSGTLEGAVRTQDSGRYSG